MNGKRKAINHRKDSEIELYIIKKGERGKWIKESELKFKDDEKQIKRDYLNSILSDACLRGSSRTRV